MCVCVILEYDLYSAACESSSDRYVGLQAFSTEDDSVKHLDSMWFRGSAQMEMKMEQQPQSSYGDGDGATTAVSISIARDLCCANCVRLSVCLSISLSLVQPVCLSVAYDLNYMRK